MQITSDASYRMSQALDHNVPSIPSDMRPQTVADQVNLVQVYVKILVEPYNESSQTLSRGPHVFHSPWIIGCSEERLGARKSKRAPVQHK